MKDFFFIIFLSFTTTLFAAPNSSKDAAQETLLWLKEKELFSLTGCRAAEKKDVREEKNNRLGDTIIRGTVTGKEAVQEINLSHYVRLRLIETSSDSLGSRLGRMGLSLLDVPAKSCAVWDELVARKK